MSIASASVESDQEPGPWLAWEFERQYREGLMRFLLDRVSSPVDAEQICDEVLQKARAQVDSFRGGSFRAWVFTIARNAAYSFHRKARNRRNTGVTGRPAPVVTRPSERPLHLQTAPRVKLRELRRQLDPQDQEILFLRYEQKFSSKEIAEYLHGGLFDSERECELAAVKARKRLSKTVKRLREMMCEAGIQPAS